MCQLPRDDLPIDRIGNFPNAVDSHETEVPDVVEIVRPKINGNLGTGKDGFDHSLDTLFPELVGKLVEVRDAILDQRLPRVINGASTDRPVPCPAGPVPETRLVRERVHQPGLAASEFPDPCQRAFLEDLPCLLRVLAYEGSRLTFREVPQTQRLGLDVEGAAAHDVRSLPAREDPAVAHIPYPAKHDALRESTRAVAIPASNLPEDRDQRVADKRVDFVNEQDQGLRVSRGPIRENAVECGVRARPIKDRRPDLLNAAVANRPRRLLGKNFEDGPHGLAGILAGGLRDLDVHVDASVPSGAIQAVQQSAEQSRLPRLPGGVQDEVLQATYEREHFVQVDSGKGRNAVMMFDFDRSLGVEEAHCVCRHLPGRVRFRPSET